jgi:adiponectin receptor
MSLYENLKEEEIKNRNNSKEKSSKINKNLNLELKEKKYKDEEKIIIGKYSDAPDYLKDNEYIKNGYLINCHTFKMVLRSLFVCSNETINIWSHLIGCIISILLIILTALFLKTSLVKELTQIEYEDLQIKINETIIPWSSELRKHKTIEIDSINQDVCSVIDNILDNTQNLVSNYGTKFTTFIIIENFIKNTKVLINKIVNYFSKDSNVLEDITTKWDLCVNRIISYIKYDLKDDIRGEHIKRWPLFIMLSAAIVCFGFSTSFHWFSIYSKNLYSLLCRLDYAGITFLIPGSCYPPYFYFYYCDICK